MLLLILPWRLSLLKFGSEQRWWAFLFSKVIVKVLLILLLLSLLPPFGTVFDWIKGHFKLKILVRPPCILLNLILIQSSGNLSTVCSWGGKHGTPAVSLAALRRDWFCTPSSKGLLKKADTLYAFSGALMVMMGSSEGHCVFENVGDGGWCEVVAWIVWVVSSPRRLACLLRSAVHLYFYIYI